MVGPVSTIRGHCSSQTAAFLAQGELGQARAMAQLGWPLAPQFDLQAYWSDNLALLAVLDGRAGAGARLLGYGDAAYARNGDDRTDDEAFDVERAERLARKQIGDDDFERLKSQGMTLRDEEVAAVAFETLRS